MVDLDHCSYATIWAYDKDCYRGSICYLSPAWSFFLLLLLLSPPLDPRRHFYFSIHLYSSCLFYFTDLSISTWARLLLSLLCPPPFSTVLFVPPQHPLPSSPLRLLISVHPSISVHWIWCCVIVSASLLGWRLSKGPQDPHTLRVSSHARDALFLLSLSSPLVHISSSGPSLSLQDRKKGQMVFLPALLIHEPVSAYLSHIC